MYKAFSADAEVCGKVMLAVIEAVQFKYLKWILEKHGINHIEPEKWYPQQVWLDIFHDITRLDDSISSHLIGIGIKIAEMIVSDLPFEKLMQRLDEFYYTAYHRGKNIGFIDSQLLGSKHVRVIDRTPYPDAMVYGLCYGLARRFLPKGKPFTVRYDEAEPRRENGGILTVVHIRWE